MPFCLLVVSQKKRKVRRCRLLMTGSPSRSGSNTRERSTTTPGTLDLIGFCSAAPATLTNSAAAHVISRGQKSRGQVNESCNLIVYECHGVPGGRLRNYTTFRLGSGGPVRSTPLVCRRPR